MIISYTVTRYTVGSFLLGGSLPPVPTFIIGHRMDGKGIWVRFLVLLRDVSFLYSVQTDTEGYPASYPMKTWCSSPAVIVAGA
jgi:hypothetical protein